MDCFLCVRYAILRPEFSMEKHEKPGGHTEYSCSLQLPCNAPFEILEGPVCSSMRLAQQVDFIIIVHLSYSFIIFRYSIS